CDFARMVHSDLPDGDFVLGSRFQNCAWQTYVIVKISFGFGDAKSSREYCRREILRARLSVASSDRQDFHCKRSPVIGCQGLVGLEGIGRTEKCEIVWHIDDPFEINERACTAGFCTGCDKIVALKIFATQCDEQFTRLNCAGICADLVDYGSPIPG